MPKKASSVRRTKRVYISDVHMSVKKKPKEGQHDYTWLTPAEAKAFAAFLEYLSTSEDVKEVILLGDIMDDWVFPVDTVPATFDDIIKATRNREIVRYLKALASHKEIKLIYMPGNHDMTIKGEILNKHFKGIVFGGSAWNKSTYRTSRLLAEHGSAHAMFNAPDPVNDPRRRLPLGYFISRVAATKAARTGNAKRHFWTYFDDFLEMLGPQRVPESVFEAILEEAGLPEDVEIEMPPLGGKGDKVMASDIKQRYADLYDQWQAHYGPGMAFKALMAEIGYLGDLADNLCKKGDTNIVIFGHSHDSEIDKDSWFVDDRIYANCGTWSDSDENKPKTFVETEKVESKGKYYVRLKSWDQGKVRELGEEYLKL